MKRLIAVIFLFSLLSVPALQLNAGNVEGLILNEDSERIHHAWIVLSPLNSSPDRDPGEEPGRGCDDEDCGECDGECEGDCDGDCGEGCGPGGECGPIIEREPYTNIDLRNGHRYDHSDHFGLYLIENINDGEYLFKIQADGYETHEQVITIEGDRTEYVDVVLSQSRFLTVNDPENQPLSPGLVGIYPNPFNATTKVSVQLADATDLNITLLNVNGRQVQHIHQGKLSVGLHSFSINAQNLSVGHYYVRLQTNEKAITKSVLLVK